MEEQLFSTAQIAAELEHKSKNPNRDVLNIGKRLGFTPVATRPREGKNPGGKPEMLWSKEQHDAILANNSKRHNDDKIQAARADVTAGTTDTVAPSTAQVTEVTDDDRPVVSEPVTQVTQVTQNSAKQEETATDDFEPQNFAELIIDEEFSSILPPLKEHEFNLLEENILRDGILDPLKVWNGILLDGHARYEIAKRHNLPFKIVEVKSVTDRDDAIIWIIKNQLARRSLNQYERAQIALKLQNEPQKK